MIKNLAHYGDILAIPFFLLASIYFYKKENKTHEEYILLIFSIIGLIFDTIASIYFILS